MKNRFSLALMTLLLIALSIPSFVFAQQQSQPQSPGRRDPSSASRPRARASRGGLGDRTAEVKQDFSEALRIVEANYIDGSKLDYNALYKSSIIGMLRTLDPHSNYFDRQEFDELKTDQRSEYYGIGASIGNQRIGKETDTYILATFENSPAARADLRFGDRIVRVNNDDMSGKSSLEVRDKIRGPRDSVVRITVERAATGRLETVEIKRDAVPQPSIPDAYMIRPGVGYIDMTHGFNYTTSDELQYALEYLHDQGMTSLVMDLRGNPGGFLDQAIRVADKFLPSGQIILTQRGRDGLGDKVYRAENSSPDSTPLVVLINGNSASASEIFAGAMQDHDRALLVGENSFGKGLVQSIIPLEYGAGLTLTSAKYYTPSGRLIQRDYSNGALYDYYTRGGAARDDAAPQSKPGGPESHTDLGRPVYSGDGITPDEMVKPRLIDAAEARLINPIFAFSRELVSGRIAGFDAYKVQRPIDFNHKLVATDYPVTDALFQAFKNFVSKDASWNITAAQLERDRDFASLQLRYNIVTAAYGRVTADQVLILDDPQVTKAIEALPRARQLAMSAMRARK